MGIRDVLNNEALAARQKAAEIVAAAEAEKARLEAQATNIESKLASIPVEIDNLSEEAWAKVRAWFSSI
jgi:predicted  nucleic acid-binding Zn-ribbon protein